MSVVVAIEAAIAGGSLSLIRDGMELGNWIGRADGRLRSEDLLIEIDAMLTACGVSKHDIDLVAVSAGPGSFTGIRIGIATALGIKAGLGIPMTTVSAMEAICRAAPVGQPADVAVAVPVGRNAVCVQSFATGGDEIRALDAPRSVPQSELRDLRSEWLVVHSALFTMYPALTNAVDFGTNIAYAVGNMSSSSPGSLIEPLFISKEGR